MKIVFIQLCGPFHKGWTYRENLLTQYLAKDNSLNVITNYDGFKINSNKTELLCKSSHEISSDIIRLPYIKCLPYFLNSKLRFYTGLLENLEAIRPDFIYINGLQFFSIFEILRYKKRYPLTKIFGELNATSFNSAKSFISRKILHGILYKYLVRRVYIKLDKLYFGSVAALNFSADLYSTSYNNGILPLGINDDKIKIINDIDKTRLRQKYGVKISNFVICTGGKLDKQKNTLQLLKAFIEIKNLDFILLIFGTIIDYNDEILEIINSSGRIVFLGWLNENEIYEVFRLADLAVFPGSKSALWESAIAIGLPLVAQYWQGVEHIDFGGNLSYLYLNGDVLEIRRNIETLYIEKLKLLQMAKIALDNGISNLSYSKVAKKILSDFCE